MSGRFITFEGIDGAGKSTHIERVARHLRQGGAELVQTREPGGTPLAESLRELFLHRDMDGLTEALLVFAARRDHVRTVIAPALAQGHTVLCDRFTDASFAYQGGGRGMDWQVLGTLERWVQEGREPDLTFWFDVDPAVAAQRRAQARDADRLEQLDLAFFERVRDAYRRRAEGSPTRFVRIDAGDTIEGVGAQVIAALEQRGW
ncbi:MAG: dTMP kinase [Mitsuaria chitosanitabida]|uniref:dTMP kinase n=1 Tax=Roseateles chitosanitabidus TaxID=65048 RepID=UPI001B00F99F|nr:dTMP kinase [Roseateles chitosanitabidus]MBO9687787.1 dTMP kinase [Roseateles chitosanitabidus]